MIILNEGFLFKTLDNLIKYKLLSEEKLNKIIKHKLEKFVNEIKLFNKNIKINMDKLKEKEFEDKYKFQIKVINLTFKVLNKFSPICWELIFGEKISYKDIDYSIIEKILKTEMSNEFNVEKKNNARTEYNIYCEKNKCMATKLNLHEFKGLLYITSNNKKFIDSVLKKLNNTKNSENSENDDQEESENDDQEESENDDQEEQEESENDDDDIDEYLVNSTFSSSNNKYYFRFHLHPIFLFLFEHFKNKNIYSKTNKMSIFYNKNKKNRFWYYSPLLGNILIKKFNYSPNCIFNNTKKNNIKKNNIKSNNVKVIFKTNKGNIIFETSNTEIINKIEKIINK